eukprot:1994247-Pyramimonas_sp.AAC.1
MACLWEVAVPDPLYCDACATKDCHNKLVHDSVWLAARIRHEHGDREAPACDKEMWRAKWNMSEPVAHPVVAEAGEC